MNYLQELQITRNNLLEQLANIDANYSLDNEEVRQQIIFQLSEFDNEIANYYSALETRAIAPHYRAFMPVARPMMTNIPRPTFVPNASHPITPTFRPNPTPVIPPRINQPITRQPYYPNINKPYVPPFHGKDSGQTWEQYLSQGIPHLNRTESFYTTVWDPKTNTTKYWQVWKDNSGVEKSRNELTIEEYYKGTGNSYRNPWDNKDYRWNTSPTRGFIGWNVYDQYGRPTKVDISPFEATRRREERELLVQQYGEATVNDFYDELVAGLYSNTNPAGGGDKRNPFFPWGISRRPRSLDYPTYPYYYYDWRY